MQLSLVVFWSERVLPDPVPDMKEKVEQHKNQVKFNGAKPEPVGEVQECKSPIAFAMSRSAKPELVLGHVQSTAGPRNANALRYQ